MTKRDLNAPCSSPTALASPRPRACLSGPGWCHPWTAGIHWDPLGSVGSRWDPLGLVDGGGLVAWWLGGLDLRHMTPDLNMKKVARIASKI